MGGGSRVCWGLGGEAEGSQFKPQCGQDMEGVLVGGSTAEESLSKA